jgi:GT2 family glycosyltransferase
MPDMPQSTPAVAILVLNFNTPHLTNALAAYLNSDLHYPNKDVYVVDNGSDAPPASATHRLLANLGFTRGMHEAWRIASTARSYDAFWFLNSDVGFEYGDGVLSALIDVLFSSDRYAQISPQFNSPHKFMERARGPAQPVPYLEPTATLIKNSTLAKLGFWDLDLTCGWGVDYDYGYRVRQAGLASILTSSARIVHKEHQSITDWSGFVEKASSEMHTVLTRKYGAGWERINHMHKFVPVVLACDRNPAVTARFSESFQSVRAGLDQPLVVVDISASPELSPTFLASIAALEPRKVIIHPPYPGMSLYDSVQDAADFALATALEETDLYCQCLFMEDDIEFSSHFLERLNAVRAGDGCGFVTFYLPGHGFGSTEFDAGRFYGTQCVLFPRHSLELLVRDRFEMNTQFPPGYDIRWSRYLASKGYKLYATDRSYVQHVSDESRLHGHRTHVSHCFLP